MFRSGMNDSEIVRYESCRNWWTEDSGEVVECGFEGEVDVVISGYSSFWTCTECDYENEEELVDALG